MMRIGFVSRAYAPDYAGGDRIFDDKTFAGLSRMARVQRLELPRDDNRRALARTVLRRSHPALETYSQSANAARIAAFAKECDVLVISHEALMAPFLASGCTHRACVLMHNVLSLALGDMGLRGKFARGAQRLERKILARPQTTMLVLSRREQLALIAEGWGGVVCAPPGVREIFATTPAVLEKDRLIVNGTIEWGLKRRDRDRLLADYRDSCLPIVLTDESEIADDGRLRLAVLPDRFQTGFKLKASDLLCRNVALISFMDLAADFPAACWPRLSLRHIENVQQIPAAICDMESNLSAIGQEIHALKLNARTQMSWDHLAETIIRSC